MNKNKKFIDIIDISDYEVLSDDGFVDIKTINLTKPYKVFKLKTESGLELKCADNHIVFKENYDECFVADLKKGDKILTNNRIDKVIEVLETDKFENMYDLELSNNSKHRYYTNSILSHNTLIAKKIAKEFFGDEKKLIRFDMSEYADKSSVSKLIGSNPGYIGYEEGGLLTETIKNNKYCVLLLDEIEKADPEIYNIFLQILDEGFLTDNSGMKIDFKNVIIFFTSNVGTKTASEFKTSIGFNDDSNDMHKKILSKELKKRFPPEFINRIDDVIYFNSLNNDDLSKIINLELMKLKSKIKNIGYDLSWSEDVIKFILKDIEDDKEYGARPIFRKIQNLISNLIVDNIIEKNPKKGKCFIFYVDNEKITLRN